MLALAVASAVSFAPSGSAVAIRSARLPMRPAATMQFDALDDAVKKLPLDKVPEPAQPWVNAYAAKPAVFLSDFVAILLFSGLSPLKALPYWLIFYGAAQPLGAYSPEATKKFISGEFAAVWAASTLGGVVLSAPFAGTLDGGVGGVVGKLLVTLLLLAGQRAALVVVETGELPGFDFELPSMPSGGEGGGGGSGFDLDSVLQNNPFKNLEKTFGWDQDEPPSPPPPAPEEPKPPSPP
tara:strand:- start:229 stop:942 length:714 start_codon:yes stop_codon:yes gene_type:complete